MAIVGPVVNPTGIASAVINPIAQTALVPVTDHVGYMISCKKYVRLMHTKMRELNTTRVSVEEHISRNKRRNFEIPSQVRGLLDDIETIKSNVENFPSDVISCCSLKIRHKLGRKAFKITEAIESVTRQLSSITWTEDPVPVGRVVSINASTSATSSDHHNDFPSREQTFTEALKALGPNHKGHMVALWGMGGVGKTTMMKKLKDVVEKKKMFNYIVMAVIGEKTDPIAIQKAVADYLGIELSESTKPARADKLRKWFEHNSDGSKNKFLIVLDDVWQFVDLEDIGLSTPSPNEDINFKILLTSRKRDVCSMMGVEANSILNVKVLEEAEAQYLFLRFVEIVDPELHQIGVDIVKKCCGLPIAIKTMARTLRNKSKDSWKDALSHLQDHDDESVVNKVFEMSYRNLQDEETQLILLLCGLFPEDFDIPTEELLRYGWGLNLFKNIHTIIRARRRLHARIELLMDSNLLIESNYGGCVKMHDLVRDFSLNMYSKVEHASIVNHGSTLEWPKNNNISISLCKAISLTCQGMFEFPEDLKFPNLSILKLMHGGKSLRFPQKFYEEMEKLQVISYDKMKYPLLPSLPQCSTNYLRVLHLHECSLKMFDYSSIGDLSNLEVLSFAESGIEWLPSTIGKLKELRLLDLTNCDGLRIENGVLQNLVKLEELYMRVGEHQSVIRFADENYNELEERSKTLSTLECQIIIANDQLPKNMLFQKLERFKIEVGRYSYRDDGDCSKSMHAYENTLLLGNINKSELLESRMNEMFKNTQVLRLEVEDMINLEDVELKSSSHPPKCSSFSNLRVLLVCKCEQLRYLFTLGVANTLSKLEYLQVNDCDNMEGLVHSGVSGEEPITFPRLKVLSLCGLPNLSGLCHDVKVIKLPELVDLKLEGIPGFTSIYPDNKLETSSFLKEEVVIPKLEKLIIKYMKNLKEIWPCDFKKTEDVKLRHIEVDGCDNLEDLFPCNPMSLLHRLEELIVKKCGSIEVLVNIDLDYIGEIGESCSSTLRSIEVSESQNLREVWRIKGADNSRLLVRGFQAIESIRIMKCVMFRNVFTPITSNFDLGALMEISLNRESTESSQEQINILSSDQETSTVSDSTIFAVPSSLIHSVQNIHKLECSNYKRKEVVFDIETSPTTTHQNQQQPLLLPNLEELNLYVMDEMSHVWKCSNWNKFLQQSESSFNNLTTIYLWECKFIKYLFSPLMAKLLFNLKRVKIVECNSIEEVVSNRDDDEGREKTTFTSASTSFDTSTTLFPHLDSLEFYKLPNFKCIGVGGGYANGGNNEILFNNSTTTTARVDQFKSSDQAGGVPWTLSQYAREISIESCDGLSSVIPCYAAGQMQKLQVLRIEHCDGMKEVFESEKKKSDSDCDEGNTRPIPAGLINHVTTHVLKLSNLKILYINGCNLLEHVFPFSALESLRQLEKLKIEDCRAMKVIVKKEEDDGEQQTTTTTTINASSSSSSSSSSSKKVVVFHSLKSIELEDLPELVGFFLGMNIEFRLPALDKVTIKDCPKMMVFAPGGSTAPPLKYIETKFAKYSIDQRGLNFHATTTAGDHLQTAFPSSLDSFPATTSEGMPYCSWNNLIQLNMKSNPNDIKKIIPSTALLQVQKLEKIHVQWCHGVEEVFEALEAGTNSSTSGFDESSQTETETTTTLVKLPNLKQVELWDLKSLRYIWKSNQWTAFEFPNLTRLSIYHCERLEHVFTSSMVGSLLQLQELEICKCKNMEEVFVRDAHVAVEAEKEEEEEESNKGKTNEIIVFPRLKSLTLSNLECLKGFSLGKEDFSFPLLDTLKIETCPAITTFTKGNSAIPKLREIETYYGSFHVAGEDINSLIKIKQQDFKRDNRWWAEPALGYC